MKKDVVKIKHDIAPYIAKSYLYGLRTVVCSLFDDEEFNSTFNKLDLYLNKLLTKNLSDDDIIDYYVIVEQ